MKRKGFMSIEMLLVIGILVGGLAAVFLVYKKIQANLASTAIVTDIATIMNGLDRYKGAVGGYPAASATSTLLSTSATFTFNAGSAYIDAGTANKWSYATVNMSTEDVDTKTSTGQIVITPDMNQYNALKTTEIVDILRGKCINGTRQIGETVAISADSQACVIYNNAILFND